MPTNEKSSNSVKFHYSDYCLLRRTGDKIPMSLGEERKSKNNAEGARIKALIKASNKTSATKEALRLYRVIRLVEKNSMWTLK